MIGTYDYSMYLKTCWFRDQSGTIQYNTDINPLKLEENSEKLSKVDDK